MPLAHDADPWVRPPLGGHETSWRYGVVRDGPGPQMDLSFADLIDIINPLQHIPLLSSFYRALTGDQIQPAAQIMGATLYGGPVGLLAASNLALIQEVAGDSPPDMLAAALIGADRPDGPGRPPRSTAANRRTPGARGNRGARGDAQPSRPRVGRPVPERRRVRAMEPELSRRCSCRQLYWRFVASTGRGYKHLGVAHQVP